VAGLRCLSGAKNSESALEGEADFASDCTHAQHADLIGLLDSSHRWIQVDSRESSQGLVEDLRIHLVAARMANCFGSRCDAGASRTFQTNISPAMARLSQSYHVGGSDERRWPSSLSSSPCARVVSRHCLSAHLFPLVSSAYIDHALAHRKYATLIILISPISLLSFIACSRFLCASH